MSSVIHTIPAPGSQASSKPSYLQRLANALVYIIAFPFIAIAIGLKRIFTEQKGPGHSYYDKLPVQHYIGQGGGSSRDIDHADATGVNGEGGAEALAGRARTTRVQRPL